MYRVELVMPQKNSRDLQYGFVFKKRYNGNILFNVELLFRKPLVKFIIINNTKIKVLSAL